MENTVKLRLICPLSTRLRDVEAEGQENAFELEADVRDHADEIRQMIQNSLNPDEQERGLMADYRTDDAVSRKVQSCCPSVVEYSGELYGTVECVLSEPLTQKELRTLKEFLKNQFEEGWGERLAQQPLPVNDMMCQIRFYQFGPKWALQEESVFLRREALQEQQNAEVMLTFRSPEGDSPAVTAYLPTDEETLEQLCTDTGLRSVDHRIKVCGCSIREMPRLENRLEIASLAEAQRLAEELSFVDRYYKADLEAFLLKDLDVEQPVSAERFINMIAWQDDLERMPEVDTPEELGRRLLEDGVLPEYDDWTEAEKAAVDCAAVGLAYAQENGGVFTEYGFSLFTADESCMNCSYEREVVELKDTAEYAVEPQPPAPEPSL